MAKTTWLQVRLDKTQKEQWRRIAEKAGIGLSELVRMVMAQYITSHAEDNDG